MTSTKLLRIIILLWTCCWHVSSFLSNLKKNERVKSYKVITERVKTNERVAINEIVLQASVSTENKMKPSFTNDTMFNDIIIIENETNLIEDVAWRGVILILCGLWASNFACAKLVMAEPGVDSSLYAVARFGIAAAALAPGAIANKARMDLGTLKNAVICGSWVAFGYLGQTFGLLTTTSSRSCVICSMHCVFVAVIAEYWRVSNESSSNFDFMRLLPAAIAVIGVAIIELQGSGGAPTIGDALSFAQPIGFGMGYLILEDLMKEKPEAASPVSFIKLLVVSLSSLILFEINPLLNGSSDFSLKIPDFSPILASPTAFAGILYTGLITTAFALWIESKAFAKVPATDASIILTTEPLIAAYFGSIALHETFGISDYIGAILIIGACVLAILIQNPSSLLAATQFSLFNKDKIS